MIECNLQCSEMNRFCGQQTLQGDASPNPSLSLLNGLGVFVSGVLGALYALARKETIASEATIDSESKFWFSFSFRKRIRVLFNYMSFPITKFHSRHHFFHSSVCV